MYGVSETARQLKKSAQTIRVWADRGKIEVIRTASGQRLFTGDAIERKRHEQSMLATEAD
jgi:DNA-binding transcriptional MerR regulator